MNIVTGRKMKMCVALMYMLSAVGCGVGDGQSAEMQTGQMQDTGVSYAEPAEEAHIEDNTDSEKEDQEAEEEEAAGGAQENGDAQYPILAEMPSDMYKYTDVGDKKSENEDYRDLHSLGLAGGGSVVFASEESYLIFDTASGTYGFLSERGEVIAPFGYEEAYPFHEGTACVRVDDKFGYIGMDGETVLPFIYNRATPFSEGLAYFVLGDTYGFMDESGEAVFYLDCESVSSFREGRAYIFKDGKYGYIDRTGAVVIEPDYDDATYFKNGVAIVRKGGFYGVIGLDGEEILPAVFERMTNEDGEFLYAKQGQTVQCFDLSGNMIIEGSFELVRLTEGCFIFREESGKSGMADEKGSVICDAMFDSVYKVPGKELVVVRAGEHGEIVDFMGETVASFECDVIGSVTKSFVEIRRDREYGVIDLSGKTVVETKYDSITLYEDGAMLLKEDGNITLQNAGGQQILSDYEVVRRIGNSYEFKAHEQGGKSGYGFADLKGNIILQPIYYDMTLFHESPLIFGSENIAIVGEKDQPNDCIVKTAPTEEDGLSSEILVNEITPGSTFYEYANAETFNTDSSLDDLAQIDIHMLDARKISRRLYGNVGSGTLLYLSVESYDWLLLPTDYYALLGEDAVKEGSACVHGTNNGGGYEYGLWYDEQEQKLVQGRAWHYGGSGNVYGRDFFEEQNGNLVIVNSWAYAYNAFEGTKTYAVNDQEATEEEYEAMRARYRWIENLE